MTKILVDGAEIDVPPEYTLLQACEAAGAEIPRFCFHERLSIAGNCRMCLIEVRLGGRAGPKPVASCAQQVKDLPPPKEGQPLNELVTLSPTVKKARQGVMEFLLINHPLDCPICDQGGECDLQDQSMAYGRGGSRFDENKRAVEEKHMGPLIKTVMTRCIQCTRCVRFATEIAGVPELGATGRGEDMEITTYLEAAMESELSANVIDLCPVGALTSRPYAFNARPWELAKTESIDVMDAMGANIRVDVRGNEVLRVLPRNHDGVNEEWISDKTRYCVDGLKRQRLDRPYLRENGKLRPANWDEALRLAAGRLNAAAPARIGALAGDLACVESVWALKRLMESLKVENLDCRQDGAALPTGPRASYLFNAAFEGLDAADCILIVGSNPRLEAPVLNARIRKAWLHGASVAYIGVQADLTYRAEHLGLGGDVLDALAQGRHPFFDRLKGAKRPVLLLGQGALGRPDGAAILRACGRIAAGAGLVKRQVNWNGFSVLHTAAGRVGALDAGFVPGPGGKDFQSQIRAGAMDVIVALNVDEVEIGQGAFVIYIGSHGDRGANRADLILPAAAYTEKTALWVNSEGRVQEGRRAAFPPGEAKEDWTILRALSALIGLKPLPFDTLAQLRADLIAARPSFAGLGYAPGGGGGEDGFDPAVLGADGPIGPQPLSGPIRDFYATNPIARASRTMAECAKSARARRAGQSPIAAE